MIEPYFLKIINLEKNLFFEKHKNKSVTLTKERDN